MNLIDVGNFAMLVERGLGPEHARILADQWNAKCAEIERLRAAITDAYVVVWTSPVRAERILRGALEQKAVTE